MVELDVEARQGDSGGPIFNQRGELAGVLFGAGQGTTLGSFAPRVNCFLATLAPDIGQTKDQALVAVADRAAPEVHRSNGDVVYPSSPWSPEKATLQRVGEVTRPLQIPPGADDGLITSNGLVTSVTNLHPSQNSPVPTDTALSWCDITCNGWYDPVKSTLAVVGLAAIALRLVKTVR
jgi:hypothetical protein